MEKLKRERAKTEVVLTTHDASDNTKDQLANISKEAITNSIQEAITVARKGRVKIRRVQKTVNHGIKIRCAMDKEAEELCSMD